MNLSILSSADMLVALRPIVDHIIKSTREGNKNKIARPAVIRLDMWEEVDIVFP